MGICPNHGHYDQVCKKCQPLEMKLGGPGVKMADTAPEIEDCDKYLLRSFEAEALNAQIEMRDAQQKIQNALQSFNRQAHAVMEKLGVDPKEWLLDAKSMTLVRRGEDAGIASHKP